MRILRVSCVFFISYVTSMSNELTRGDFLSNLDFHRPQCFDQNAPDGLANPAWVSLNLTTGSADIKMHPNLISVQQNSAQPGVGQSLLAPNVVSSQGPLTLNCTASFRSLGISLAGAAFHRQLSMLMAAALPMLTFKVYCLCCIRWWWLLIASKVFLLVILCFRLKVADFPVQILLMLIQESQPAGSQRIFQHCWHILSQGPYCGTVANALLPVGPRILGSWQKECEA